MRLINTLLVVVFLLTTVASCRSPRDPKLYVMSLSDWVLCVRIYNQTTQGNISDDGYKIDIAEKKRRGLDCTASVADYKKTKQKKIKAKQATVQTIEQSKGSTGLTAEQIALKLQLDRIEEKLADIKRQAAKDKRAAKRAASDAEWDRSIELMRERMRELIYK